MHSLNNKSLLVTGGAGFIGSHLVDALIAEGPGQLVVVDDLFLGKEDNLAQARKRFPSLVFLEQDAADLQAMEEICNTYRVEVVFNLAVIPLPKSLEDPKFTVDKNVTIVSTLCELARRGAYESLIHFSSSEAYGTAQMDAMSEKHPTAPLTPYAASKLAGDHVILSCVETFGLDASIVRPFNNYGPRQNEQSYAGVIPKVIQELLTGQRVTVFGDGRQTRDFIFVTDTVKGAVDCYHYPETRGKVINLGSGSETRILDLIRQLVTISGGNLENLSFAEERPGDVSRHCADISMAQRLLEFRPRVSLDDGLRQTFDWYNERLEPEQTFHKDS